MKYTRFILLVIISFLMITPAKSQTRKRGLAYGYHYPEDLNILSPAISWWYNWSVAPENSVAEVYGNYGFEFVPMTWNGSYDETKLRAFLTAHPETKYLLAFNEPNFIEQANMKPSEAAAQWPRLEAIADEFNLKIVGPAVNFCGNCVQENGITYTDPVKYLDDFFAACPGCRVDYIAVHCYMNTLSALEWYMGLFKKYGKPIWLTEFSGWEPNGNIKTVEDQINFMIGAVDYLENDTMVYKYAWFIGRGVGITTYPFIDLLGTKGKLTELGSAYKQMPVHDTNMVVSLPSTIEAENYNRMHGIRLEKTSDQYGFINAGYIDQNDWLEYKIFVEEPDTFDIHFRIASTKNAVFEILINGESKLVQNIPNTGGWQSWRTISNQISLEQGIHTFRLRAMSDGFNLNWIHIGSNPLNVLSLNKTQNHQIYYPNPTSSSLNVKAFGEITCFELFSMDGKKIKTLPFSTTLDLGFLKPGVYFIYALDNKGIMLDSEKIIVQ